MFCFSALYELGEPETGAHCGVLTVIVPPGDVLRVLAKVLLASGTA